MFINLIHYYNAFILRYIFFFFKKKLTNQYEMKILMKWSIFFYIFNTYIYFSKFILEPKVKKPKE